MTDKIHCPYCKKGILDISDVEEAAKKRLRIKLDEELDEIFEKL